MITCADFHAVFAFLLAGGKKINNIRREMWKVKDILTLEQGVEEEYASFKWAQTYSQEMNELLDLTWNDQYRLFDQVEAYLDDPKNV
jgi:N12 class adenine-specific DNA methylase